MAFKEYNLYDGLGLAELVRKGEVSPSELVEEAIVRIERHNPKLNAVIYKAYGEARLATKTELADGPFKGVPFLIKDIDLPVRGWPMTNGSAYLRGYVYDFIELFSPQLTRDAIRTAIAGAGDMYEL